MAATLTFQVSTLNPPQLGRALTVCLMKRWKAAFCMRTFHFWSSST